jgi:hypothetical protein
MYRAKKSGNRSVIVEAPQEPHAAPAAARTLQTGRP